MSRPSPSASVVVNLSSTQAWQVLHRVTCHHINQVAPDKLYPVPDWLLAAIVEHERVLTYQDWTYRGCIDCLPSLYASS